MAPTKQVVKASEAQVAQFDPDQTLKASKALLAHIKKAAEEKEETSEKKNLLASEDEGVPIWLTMTTKRHIADSSRLKPGKIPLPHPLNTDEEATICLITADPQRAYKDLVAEISEPLRSRVTRVVDFTHIKKKFSQYEAQRKLFADHEIFLGDDRIINRLPAALGKTFYKTTTKRPIPVSLQGKGSKSAADKKSKKNGGKSDGGSGASVPTVEHLEKEIEKAIGCALVNLTPSPNTSVRIGNTLQTAEQLAENAVAVAEGLVAKFVPKGISNVKNVLIKGPETAALPIWMTEELWLDEKDVIPEPTEEEKKAIKEKSNIGKKRKSISASAEDKEVVENEKPAKKSKKEKAAAVVAAESNDDKLDQQIADRKERLRKQKAKAKANVD